MGIEFGLCSQLIYRSSNSVTCCTVVIVLLCSWLCCHWLQIGAFFLINLCLVVIATQFSETKKREMSRMLAERKRFQTSSSSTLASSSEPGGCYDELIKYASHIARKVRRRLQRLARRAAQNHRRRRVTPERAAVAVSLRRRRRRRRAGRAQQQTESAAHHATATPSPLVTATPPSPVRRPSSSAIGPEVDNVRQASRPLPEPGPSQQPVLQVLSPPDSETHQQPQQQQEAARRPDFLRMPSHDSVGYASIVSVLSWSSLPTPSVYIASPPPPPQAAPPVPGSGSGCRHESMESDSVTATSYLVLPLELVAISPQSRRASSASGYLRDFCCLSPEQQLVLENCPAISAVDRVRGCFLRSESLGSSEPRQPAAPGAASSRHRFANRAFTVTSEVMPPSLLTHSVSCAVQPDEVVRDKTASPTAQPPDTGDISSGSKSAKATPESSSLPSSVRRNSVNRASSLSSATPPRTKSNFLAVPAPVIGAGARRASVGRARSLGNYDDASCSGTQLLTSQIPHILTSDTSPVARPPATAAVAQPSDSSGSVSPCPPATVCDRAGASSTSLPDGSTSGAGGVNLRSRTNNDVLKVKATQRMTVGRASSFTAADYAERHQRAAKSPKLVHQTSSILPQSPKISSADSVYQRSSSIISTAAQGLPLTYKPVFKA